MGLRDVGSKPMEFGESASSDTIASLKCTKAECSTYRHSREYYCITSLVHVRRLANDGLSGEVLPGEQLQALFSQSLTSHNFATRRTTLRHHMTCKISEGAL